MQSSWLPVLNGWNRWTFALCAKDTYIKGRYSDCICSQLSLLLKKVGLAVPIHLGVFREPPCYQSLLFVQTPIRKPQKRLNLWQARCDVSWNPGEWLFLGPAGLTQTAFSVFDSWCWIPACTGSHWPPSGAQAVEGLSTISLFSFDH